MMTEEMRKTIIERVEAAAVKLDNTMPDWRKRINLMKIEQNMRPLLKFPEDTEELALVLATWREIIARGSE
jgi:hypothetical protein